VFASLASLPIGGCDRRASSVPSPYQGVVELDQRTLSFEVGGRLVTVPVRRGDRVEPGQVLATLDDTLARQAVALRQADIDTAEAQLAVLEAGARPEDLSTLEAQVRALQSAEKTLQTTLARARRLLADHASTQAVADELEGKVRTARAQREAAQHQLAAARSGARPTEIEVARSRVAAAKVALAAETERLDKLVLRAPAAGTLLEVTVDPGEVVGPGTPVATLGDPAHPYADVFVAIPDLAPLHVGDAAELVVDGTSGPTGASTPATSTARQTFAATIEHIASTTEFTPRYVFSEQERPHLVVRVRLRIADPERHLHPGLPAFARFSTAAPAPTATPGAPSPTAARP